MGLEQIELTLLPASDDPERVCYGTQAKLLAIQEYLRQHRVNVVTVGTRPSGDTHMGQFIITHSTGAIPAIEAIARAWIETRFGRRVRFGFGSVEVEVRTAQALDGVLQNELRREGHGIVQTENVDG